MTGSLKDRGIALGSIDGVTLGWGQEHPDHKDRQQRSEYDRMIALGHLHSPASECAGRGATVARYREPSTAASA
jgi:hypothetical protein